MLICLEGMQTQTSSLGLGVQTKEDDVYNKQDVLYYLPFQSNCFYSSSFAKANISYECFFFCNQERRQVLYQSLVSSDIYFLWMSAKHTGIKIKNKLNVNFVSWEVCPVVDVCLQIMSTRSIHKSVSRHLIDSRTQ